jgi:hypothetical protein
LVLSDAVNGGQVRRHGEKWVSLLGNVIWVLEGCWDSNKAELAADKKEIGYSRLNAFYSGGELNESE